MYCFNLLVDDTKGKSRRLHDRQRDLVYPRTHTHTEYNYHINCAVSRHCSSQAALPPMPLTFWIGGPRSPRLTFQTDSHSHTSYHRANDTRAIAHVAGLRCLGRRRGRSTTRGHKGHRWKGATEEAGGRKAEKVLRKMEVCFIFLPLMNLPE